MVRHLIGETAHYRRYSTYADNADSTKPPTPTNAPMNRSLTPHESQSSTGKPQSIDWPFEFLLSPSSLPLAVICFSFFERVYEPDHELRAIDAR